MGTVYNTSSGNKFPIYVLKGYVFQGWYAEKEGITRIVNSQGDSVDSEGNNIAWQIPNDCNLYAIFALDIYRITYVMQGGEEMVEVPTTYTIMDNIVLPTPNKFGYVFKGWEYEGKIINKITKGDFFGNIKLIANWEGDVRVINNESSNVIKISNRISIVDLRNVTLNGKVVLEIQNSVDELSIIGDNRMLTNKGVIVNYRTNHLIMRLKDIKMKGLENKAVINARDCSNLTLECFGDVYLESGDITKFENDGAAFICMNLILTGDRLTVRGASATGNNGVDGLNEASGVVGGSTNPRGSLTCHLSYLTCIGGDGSNGLKGVTGITPSVRPKAANGKVGEKGKAGGTGGNGGIGGDGGYGFVFWGSGDIDITNLVFQGGSAGNGGDGGTGGKGGTGGEGGDAVLFGPSGKNGGDGGRGGTGGIYGAAGKAGQGYLWTVMGHGDGSGSITTTPGKDAVKGKLGEGGEGGEGGLGGWYLNKKKRHDSGNKGSQGAIGGTLVIG